MSYCSCPLGAFPSTENVVCKENFGQIQKVIFVDLRDYGKGKVWIPSGWDIQGIHSAGLFREAVEQDSNGLIVDFIPAQSEETIAWAENIDSFYGLFSFIQILSGAETNDYGENYKSQFGAPLLQVSPFLEAPSQEPGEARTFGGGNDTPNGVERFLGMGPSRFSAVMRGVPQSTIAQMKELVCLSKAGQLGVILVNGEGHLEMLEGPDVVTQPFSGVGYDGNSSYPAYWPIPVRSLQISDKVHGGYEEPDRNEISWEFLPNYSDRLVIITDDEYLHYKTTKTILDMKNM